MIDFIQFICENIIEYHLEYQIKIILYLNKDNHIINLIFTNKHDFYYFLTTFIFISNLYYKIFP